MGVKFGFLSKLYLNGGTHASPTWGEAKLVSDCTLSEMQEELAADARVSVVGATEPGMRRYTLTFAIRKDSSNTQYAALEEAWQSRGDDAMVEVLVLDGSKDVVGSAGVRFWGKMTEFGQPQNLSNVLYVNIKMQPCVCPSGEEPAYAKVALVETVPTLQYTTAA